jgi:hypothetical protein
VVGLSSLRALFLALAMVLQTAAGGASLAHVALVSPEHALCHEHHAQEQSTPAHPAEKSSHHHDCRSCCFCAEPWHAWIRDWTHEVAASVGYALIEFGAADASRAASLSARSHRARAPPGVFA